MARASSTNIGCPKHRQYYLCLMFLCCCFVRSTLKLQEHYVLCKTSESPKFSIRIWRKNFIEQPRVFHCEAPPFFSRTSIRTFKCRSSSESERGGEMGQITVEAPSSLLLSLPLLLLRTVVTIFPKAPLTLKSQDQTLNTAWSKKGSC